MNKVFTSTIDALLPQSQCRQCNYPCCYDYAQAIAEQNEAINKCAYGGRQVMLDLAKLLNKPPQYPVTDATESKVAFINEDNCIGCTKCIDACPTEAIIGAKRQLHTIVRDYCTGCNLCIIPCPTNCITLISIAKLTIAPSVAKQRFAAKNSRHNKPQSLPKAIPSIIDPRKKAVADAIARAQAKKSQQANFKIDLTLYKK